MFFGTRRRIIYMIVLCSMLAACSSNKYRQNSGGAIPRDENPSPYGNPEKYKALGQTYYVKKTSKGYKERGIASWYGKDFHSKRTSSGTPYDMHTYSAAHKTLPIPSYVRVTNLDNNKHLILRVDDRGPFKPGRIIDLSFLAAKDLGVIAKGTARVEVEALEPYQDLSRKRIAPSPQTIANAPIVKQYAQPTRVAAASKPVTPTKEETPKPSFDAPVSQQFASTFEAPTDIAPNETWPLSQNSMQSNTALDWQEGTPISFPDSPVSSEPNMPKNAFFVQLGAFGEYKNAQYLSEKAQSYQKYTVKINSDKSLHRVMVGPYQDVVSANRALQSLKSSGFDAPKIVHN